MLGKGLALVKEVSAGMMLSSEAILVKLQRLTKQIQMQKISIEP